VISQTQDPQTKLGALLRKIRKDNGFTLAVIKKRMKGGLSVQSLSLIEQGEMSVSPERRDGLVRAYCTTAEQRKLIDDRFVLTLPALTTESQELITAFESVSDPGRVFVVGGRQLRFRNAEIRNHTVNFLMKNEDNQLMFFYPNRYEDYMALDGNENLNLPILPTNNRSQLHAVSDFLTGAGVEIPKRQEQVQFFKIDGLNGRRRSSINLQALILCHPFVSIIIVKARHTDECAGYAYVQFNDLGEQYVLLSPDRAREIVRVIKALLEDPSAHGCEREKVVQGILKNKVK